jgi:hypothetical protein
MSETTWRQYSFRLAVGSELIADIERYIEAEQKTRPGIGRSQVFRELVSKALEGQKPPRERRATLEGRL